jgi:hypothetical protein
MHFFVEIVASGLRHGFQAKRCICMQVSICSPNPATNPLQHSHRTIQHSRHEAAHYTQINTKN